jgi:methylenetetrahydrofolate--tRNA-(uracil-5-)-methyltransferase
MNVNFGLFPPLPPGSPLKDDAGKKLRGAEKAAAKKRLLSRRAESDLEAWLADAPQLAHALGPRHTRA